jgi:hypothetical protein
LRGKLSALTRRALVAVLVATVPSAHKDQLDLLALKVLQEKKAQKGLRVLRESLAKLDPKAFRVNKEYRAYRANRAPQGNKVFKAKKDLRANKA